MNWVKKKNLPTIEAIYHEGQPCNNLEAITNGYLLVCDLQEWSSKGSKMQSSLATKDVVKSEV